MVMRLNMKVTYIGLRGLRCTYALVSVPRCLTSYLKHRGCQFSRVPNSVTPKYPRSSDRSAASPWFRPRLIL